MKKFLILLFLINCYERWDFVDNNVKFYAKCKIKNDELHYTFSWKIDKEDNCIFYNSYRYDLVSCYVKNYNIILRNDNNEKLFIFKKKDKILLQFVYYKQFCKKGE